MGDCYLMGHGGYSLPQLDPSYPKDVTLTTYTYTNKDAAFQVIIAKDGRPKKYSYKWYLSEDEGKTFKEISSGQDENILYLPPEYVGEQAYQVYCEVSNKKGTVKSRVAKMTISVTQPLFTYMVNNVDQSKNAAYVVKDGWETNNWKLKFLQSGVLTFINRGNAKNNIDLFLVGGGGGGQESSVVGAGGGGGGGGRCVTQKNISVLTNTSYPIVIGAGGEANSNGGSSNAFNFSADGGKGSASAQNIGCDGGSGGGGGGYNNQGRCEKPSQDSYDAAGQGGSNGEDGKEGKVSGGKGLDNNTREFGDENGQLYAGGGAGGAGHHVHGCGHQGEMGWGAEASAGGGGASGKPGDANMGGGGSGSCHATNGYSAQPGGSGIVIIRNARS